jgi:hypothetical protein
MNRRISEGSLEKNPRGFFDSRDVHQNFEPEVSHQRGFIGEESATKEHYPVLNGPIRVRAPIRDIAVKSAQENREVVPWAVPT